MTFTLFRAITAKHFPPSATCVIHAPHINVHMPTARAELTSCAVDLETFCLSLVIEGMSVVSALRPYASSAVQSLWRHRPRIATVQEMLQDKRHWLWQRWQHQLRTREASVALLPPRLHGVPPPLHAASTTESLGDIKTHLQLLHATLDDLRQKGKRWDDNVGRLQGALRDVRTCCSAAREQCTACARLPRVASLGRQSCSIQPKRAVACPNTLLLLRVDRLDMPM